jgi:uncharacterized protein
VPGPVAERIGALNRVLDGVARVAVAVSGGVDSVTLAYAAHRQLGNDATMFHAVSPAVPPEATERTREHAERFGWKLEIVDAGEFSDPEYLRNPVNRCFFCKSSLYGTIARRSTDAIVSGTNLDDLSDFRPGLQAAAIRQVRHPYVEAGIDKAMVRAIAGFFGLEEMADLPASPCLSSRIETGIAVEAPTLGLVHAVEKFLSSSLQAKTVRCRVRRTGLVIELDEPTFERVMREPDDRLREELEQLCTARGFPAKPRFERYAMGSAFLRKQ